MSETERPAAHIWKHMCGIAAPWWSHLYSNRVDETVFAFSFWNSGESWYFWRASEYWYEVSLCFSNSLRVFLMTSMKTQKNRSFVISGRTGSLNVSFLVTNRNTYQRSDVLQTQRCEFDDQQFSLTAQTQTEVRPHRNHIQHFFFWPYQTFSRSSSEESTRPTSSSSWSG